MAVLLKSRRTRVLVHYPVVTILDEESEKCRDADEDGGIFLGSYRGPHLEVTDYTRSGPTDKRHRYSFVRQDDLHQEFATQAWRKSDETITFIGEWHTHPRGAPEPSFTDRDNWSQLTRIAKNPMVFAVVAPGRWALYLIRSGALWKKKALVRVEEGALGAVFQPGGLSGLF